MNSKTANDFINTLGEWFDSLPALPKKWREVIVKIIPILSLILGLLGVLASVSSLSGVAKLAAYGYGMGMIAMVLYLVGSTLLIAAYPGLKAKKHKGWRFLFWSQSINFIGGVISMSGILSAVVGALIGFYLLFQIRSYYK